MIASFFRSLEANGAAYLLISGQATVLYGAATFSEDIDLWIEPSSENVERFRVALSAAAARYYKLTPPLEPSYLRAGHGFHFLLGEQMGDAVFLDVVGRPPRSRAFADYPIVSALTLRLLEESHICAEILNWALTHLFTTESFLSFNERYPQWVESSPPDIPSSLTGAARLEAGEISDTILEQATRWMATSMALHQLADRRYWRPIIAELRALRSQRILMAEGTPV